MPIKSMLSSAFVGLLATAQFASAHTWVEQLMVIAPNGTLVGQPGYARGNVLRSSPGFGDPTMVNLIPPDGRTINQIQPTDLMCKSSQTSQTQTSGSPRLQAAPGSAVALRFQENGHVTLPDNQPGKPPNRGTVYVYGTTQPNPDDSFLAIHRVWNADGTGGDGRGVLLSTRNFDDGQCYQTNGGSISQQRQQQFKHPFDMLMGNDLWCQQDIQLPSSAPSGQPYTLYWVWDWPTLPGTAGFPDGKQEIYTTCMDIDIVGSTGVDPMSQVQASFSQGQPVNDAAVPDQMADIANPTAVTGSTIPFSASATGPAVGAASEASVSAATATDTGVPGFLSVHTGSTAGPGAETQSFTVIPIGVSPGEPQQTGGFGGGFGGGNGRENGRGGGGNNSTTVLNITISSPSSPSEGVNLLISFEDDADPQVTPAADVNNAAVATFTEYESVTETVFETVYNTRFTKRDDTAPEPTPAPALDARAAAPAAAGHSTDHGAFRLRARNPFVWLGWSTAAKPTPTLS